MSKKGFGLWSIELPLKNYVEWWGQTLGISFFDPPLPSSGSQPRVDIIHNSEMDSAIVTSRFFAKNCVGWYGQALGMMDYKGSFVPNTTRTEFSLMRSCLCPPAPTCAMIFIFFSCDVYFSLRGDRIVHWTCVCLCWHELKWCFCEPTETEPSCGILDSVPCTILWNDGRSSKADENGIR